MAAQNQVSPHGELAGTAKSGPSETKVEEAAAEGRARR
jgi:hypothetical protein